MITLYRVPDCAACDEAQEALRELVVAHRVVDVTREPVPAGVEAVGMNGAGGDMAARFAGRDFPVIADGDKLISGPTAIHDYLVDLTRELEQWRKFQTDACYIDDEGKTC